MAHMAFFGGTNRSDNRTRSVKRRIALGLVLGALSSGSPAVQAANTVIPGFASPTTMGGGNGASAAAWSHCSAGSAIDNGPSASPRFDWSFLDQAAAPWRPAERTSPLTASRMAPAGRRGRPRG